VVAERQQAELETAFAKPPPRVIRGKPLPGDSIAKLTIPRLDRSYFVVEGTAAGDLRKGPGHYGDTPLPGKGGTIGIAGHRTTYGAPFRNIDDLKRGDEVRIEMARGRFFYRVEKTRLVSPSEVSVKDRVGYERLILTACHPLYSAAQRIVVFARLVKRDLKQTVR
jgi:sortase A